MQIHERIKDNFSNLSHSQKKVAHYLLGNLEEVFSSSANEIASLSDVSEATVHRLAQELGYESFRNMKKDIQQFIRNDYRSVNNLLSSTTLKEENWLEGHFVQEAENIIHTSKQIKQEEINIAAEAFLRASHIWVAGWRMGLSVTSYLQFILKYMLGNSTSIPQGEVAEYAAYIKKEDVVFLSAFPRYDVKVLQIAKIAREKGAYVIGITDSPVAPIKEYTNLCLTVKIKSKGFVDSYTASVSVCNAIVQAISYLGEDKVKNNIKQIEENFVTFQQGYAWKYE
ncbi:MurR/RpiR family transcriptional regulator [Oceanobacillus salinisoli]|uniref:MurR/RpiR family transcriptional regulator n=1 Tax=Oceanobacillus salinisoli TaxID=2678611 RepID=UPI001E38E41C|nr:MurR/RpiR family transcriptional regulator [Oceanobacillus salinisoli]